MSDAMTRDTREDTPANYSASQWAAVTECDRHLLVSAGAGTGKTHTVVGRLLWVLGVAIEGRVNENPLRMRELAAITYTNQAAAELKRKLRAELRKAGRRDLAREVDTARVGTIHSFCDDVSREFSLRGGSPPGARVLNEGEAKALIAECARERLMGALERGDVAGLQELLADYSVRDVERWMVRLAGDADRLGHLARAYDDSDAREQALIRLAEGTLALLGERLREQGAVDFDRMVVATRDLIRDDAGVRRALRHRVRLLVVDEFQDVDPVQRDIVFMLGGIGEDSAVGGDLVTRLMLVGDPKQSIYRFRRADVTVWNDVERRFEGDGRGRVIQLAENRRSVSPVLAFVEECIGPLLDAPIDPDGGRQAFEVPFAPVTAVRSDAPSHAGVEFLVVPPDDEGKARGAEQARAMEAASVATRMIELHDGGVPWREMAILLPTWSSLAIYRDALRQRDIPTYALKNKGFHESRAVLDILLALQVARDPHDDGALMGFLRGPFVGVRDDTLLAVARGCRRPYWDHLDGCDVADEAERALLADGREMIARLAGLRDRVPVGELVEELVYGSGFLAHLALMGEDGAQEIANVRMLLGELHARRDVSVGDLLREIEEARDRRDDVPQARLYGESEDVVTITSIHGAKGLEWGVVFWCDMMRAGRTDSEKLVVGRDRILLGAPDVAAKDQGAEWAELRERGEQEARAERYRLWYVASTRAKDLLVLSGVPCGTGGRYGDNFAKVLCSAYPGIQDGGEVEVKGLGATFHAPVRLAAVMDDASSVGGEPNEGGTSPLLHDIDALLRQPPAPIAVPDGLGRHSATSLMSLDRCARRHWMRHTLGLREPDVDDAGVQGATGGPGFQEYSPVTHGQIVHHVLERLDDDADLDQLLDSALERWDPDDASGTPPGYEEARARRRERLKEEIDRVAADPMYAAIATLPSARHELQFVHIVSETAHVVGSMDLAAVEDGRVVVLDTKTSRVDGEEAARAVAARYDVQRDVYSAAASAISGLPLSRFLFHFTNAGVQVDAGPPSPATRLPESVAIGGSHAMARDPRDCVRCGYRLAGWCPGVPMPGGAPDGMNSELRGSEVGR